MSYQIKSTPFLRRIVSTSKKNGELQKLKQEYERIKDFNEHNIEMKMRQVRLKRLFREIEEIKESNTNRMRRRKGSMHEPRPKTMEELRAETMVKAKELGKEYSKLNALMVERTLHRFEQSKLSSIAEQVNDKRSLIVKGVRYGNMQSQLNMQKAMFVSKPQGSRPVGQLDSSIDKLEQLRSRLKYGNWNSFCNMLKGGSKDKKMKSNPHLNDQETGMKMDIKVPIIKSAESFKRLISLSNSIAESEQTLRVSHYDVVQRENSSSKMFENLEKSPVHVPNNVENAAGGRSKPWRKLRLLVLCNFDRFSRRHQLPLDQKNEEEFQLRTIPKSTYLPEQQIPNYSCDAEKEKSNTESLPAKDIDNNNNNNNNNNNDKDVEKNSNALPSTMKFNDLTAKGSNVRHLTQLYEQATSTSEREQGHMDKVRDILNSFCSAKQEA